MKIYKSTGTLNPEFMWSYFKYRMFPYNLRWGPILFISPARSSIYGSNSVHFSGSLIWNKLPNLVKSSRSISEFKNIIKKIGNIDCGWYDMQKVWANFHVRLVLLCVFLDYVDTSHLALCCSQMTGCYMICKNAQNAEHLGYWLKVCHFLYHFVCHFFLTLYEYFVIFVSWFLLVIS